MPQPETADQRLLRSLADLRALSAPPEEEEILDPETPDDGRYTRSKKGGKNNRWTIRRRVDEATHNMDRAIEYLMMAGNYFEDVHPDYYQAFYSLIISQDQLKSETLKLKELI